MPEARRYDARFQFVPGSGGAKAGGGVVVAAPVVDGAPVVADGFDELLLQPLTPATVMAITNAPVLTRDMIRTVSRRPAYSVGSNSPSNSSLPLVTRP